MSMGTRDTIHGGFAVKQTLAWWKNSTQYNVYDAFTGSDGTAFDGAKWTLSGTAGAATIQSNTGRVEANYGGNSSGTYTATSNAIAAGSSIYFEITTSTSCTSVGGSSSSVSAGVNGVEYFAHSNGDPASTQNLGTKASLRVEYVGGTSYEIWCNGVYITTITSVSAPTIYASSSCTHYIADSNTPGYIYIDNVRYK